MIIDAHGHVTAPAELYAYKAGLLSHRGAHGKGSLGLTDEQIEASSKRHLAALDEVGIDKQLISPRPFQMMHSEKPEKIVYWWIEAVNDVIGKQVTAHPDRFAGVAGLPQLPGVSPKNCIAELERCIKELGFVGCLINPDPGEGEGQTPTMGEEYWYPLYEKLVELGVPAMVHSAGCKNFRESYSNHFITEETIAVLSLANSNVFKDFPGLKIIVPHGGGSVPYQIGRWRAQRRSGESFDESLRRLYFDAVLYNQESIEFLFRIVGIDRCLFGTERPGTGAAKDPKTGRWLDDLKPVIENISWLSQQDRQRIFEDNARIVFNLDKKKTA